MTERALEFNVHSALRNYSYIIYLETEIGGRRISAGSICREYLIQTAVFLE